MTSERYINAEKFKERYAKLNRAQKEAVDTIDGPVLIVAGPGSGKTEILSLRVAHILQKTDVYPGNILCLTFTDAASVNMRKRLETIIGQDAYRTSIYTFHSFALSVIDRHPEFFYGGAQFSPAEEAYQAQVLEDIFTNMSYDNPLRSEHPEKGYVYMYDVKQAISTLKKAGLLPQEFKAILDANALEMKELEADIDRIFSPRLTNQTVEEAEKLLGKLKSLEDRIKCPLLHFGCISSALIRSLRIALDDVAEEGKNAPLSQWKSDFTRAVDGKRVLKATEYEAKMYALADVYEIYVQRLRNEGYVDFDDMLLDVISALETNEVLRAELEEQFRYILVDEFQDTNDAQMRLLLLLTSSPIHEGKPNIMAVGDDDQAIYRFQGAEVSNILQFTDTYKDAKVITMTHNYRSIQPVLDIARHVITQGEERLESLLPHIEKTLISAKENLKEGSIKTLVYKTPEHELHGIALECKKLIESGHPMSEIAVIGRRHRDLESLVPYFHDAGIPVSYERSGNVLNEKHIRELIQMARFIASVARHDKEEADELLPEILSYAFWNIPRADIWRLSLEASRKDTRFNNEDESHNDSKLWIEVMLESENKIFKDIAEFFIRIAQDSLHTPLEYILDDLVGAHIPLVPDDDSEDIIEEIKDKEFVSPYKEYYFSKSKFDDNRDEYLRFLTSLKTLVSSLREYKSGEMLSLSDFIHFVDIHEKNKIPITNNHPFANGVDAVHLLSAHKSKGLEFETVFVLSAIEEVWAGRGRGSLLPFPPNLPIAPAGDTVDDQIRLFYVALTRAKHNLFVCRYTHSDGGKEKLPIPFLSGTELTLEFGEDGHEMKALEAYIPQFHTPPFKEAEKSLLSHLVEDYQLSVTHFNNFLDVSIGGPQTFLEQNLLRFPQPKSVSGVFGTAIHATLEEIYVEVKKGKEVSLELVLEYFTKCMKRARIARDEKERLIKRGQRALTLFWNAKKDTFDKSHLVECNFKDQGVCIDGPHLAGKIDKMVIRGKEVIVHDWKTGSPENKWSDSSIKLWRYKNQLLFYKLLVEHSRDWGREYKVHQGVLEFVEPDAKGNIVTLELTIEDEEIKRITKLISKVCEHIKNLDFPDVSRYSKDMKGIREFEEELLT